MKTIVVTLFFMSVVTLLLGIAVIERVSKSADDLYACKVEVAKLKAEKQEMIDYMGVFLPKKFRVSE